MQIRYLSPARLDDALAVHTICTAISGARLNAVQRVYCGTRLLTDAQIEACVITLKGRPRRIPQELRVSLAPYLSETSLS